VKGYGLNGYRDAEIGVGRLCLSIFSEMKKVGSGRDSAGYCGTHALYAWPRALVVKVWVYDVMG